MKKYLISFLLLLTTSTAFADPIATLLGHTERVNSAAFNSDGKLIVSSAYNEIIIWDSNTGKALKQFGQHGTQYNYVAFGKDDKEVLSRSNFKNGIELWDVNSGSILHYFRGDELIRDAKYSPNKDLIATSSDKSLVVLDAKSGNTVWKADVATGHVNFSHDGTKLIYSAYDFAIICDAKTGEVLNKFRAQYGQIDSITFTPDDSGIVTGHNDLAVFWGVKDNGFKKWLDFRNEITFGVSVIFSPNNGNFFVSPPAEAFSFSYLFSSSGRVKMDGAATNDGAFSPDGKVAVTTFLKSVLMWKL